MLSKRRVLQRKELRINQSKTVDDTEAQSSVAVKLLPCRKERVLARIFSESLESCSDYVGRWAVERGAE